MRYAATIVVSGIFVAFAGLASAETVSPDAVSFTDDNTIPQSLTGKPGDPANGRKVFADRKLGNCLACHVNSDQSEQLFHGEVGPPLDGVADRWSEAELRAILVNSKVPFGDGTIMPSFYRSKNGARTMEKFQGKTILSAEQVEDVLAYLTTLKE
jgi:sulfur-oxidizing protein SoxX